VLSSFYRSTRSANPDQNAKEFRAIFDFADVLGGPVVRRRAEFHSPA
jgi:hypothetical protein